MPHQCTNCGRSFDDGSKEMLSGCPDCGGNKFQFHPSEGALDDDPDETATPPDPPSPDSSVARTVGSAAATVRDLVGSNSTEPGAPADVDAGVPEPDTASPTAGADESPPTTPTSDVAPGEDAAQADARSEVVSPDEIPTSGEAGWSPAGDAANAPATDRPDATVADSPEPDRPDLEDLRAELNDQFESIKVLSPGHYELNLMELYDREEYIIALQEDGRYTIQVPETWHDD
ncbi:MAG: Zn-ribbon domain-containing protein [Halorientalis sp.]